VETSNSSSSFSASVLGRYGAIEIVLLLVVAEYL